MHFGLVSFDNRRWRQGAVRGIASTSGWRRSRRRLRLVGHSSADYEESPVRRVEPGRQQLQSGRLARHHLVCDVVRQDIGPDTGAPTTTEAACWLVGFSLRLAVNNFKRESYCTESMFFVQQVLNRNTMAMKLIVMQISI